MDVKKEPFGSLPDGTAVDIYTLTNDKGLRARLMTYGAILVSLEVPDRAGKLGDIVLGYDKLDGYLKGTPYFGAIVGRYGNRIAKGTFTLDGSDVHAGRPTTARTTCTAASRASTRSSGTAEPVERGRRRRREVHLPQQGRRGGLPRQPHGTVVYTLTERQRAQDRLRGHDRQGDAGQPDQPQLLQPRRRRQRRHPRPRARCSTPTDITPVDAGLIPTGELGPSRARRWTSPTPDGDRRHRDRPQVEGGYDHNYVLNEQRRRAWRWRRACPSRRAAGSWRS